MATPSKSRMISKAKNLAKGAGFDVEIGARTKHFATRAEAMKHALGQQSKGVHALFVIVDGDGKRETFTRAGKIVNPHSPEMYRRAKEADDKFQAALVKEYGPRAGDMRYRTAKLTPAIRALALKYQAAMEAVHKNPGKAKRNPESGALAMRESFTGLPSKKTIVVGEDLHVHSHLAALGELVSMRVKTIKGEVFDIGFGKEQNPKRSALGKVRGWIDRRGKAITGIATGMAKTWINPKRTNSGGVVLLCATEDGKNLTIECGSQALDLKALNLGEFADKESVIIGEIKTIDYFATKDWQDGKKPETAVYTHKLNESTGGPLPMLRYNTRNNKCFIDGGLYRIKRPLFGQTSPGIEN